MALFKCKMCGGDLDITEGVSVAECEYCGTKQTVPRAIDDNLKNLFNRANTLRIKSEFDKAEKLYEKIIQVDPTQSEAYWGLILCKYGIEYVDDPDTFNKIPTCHRTSYDTIIADADYKSAIENADPVQRAIYEAEASEIDRIQKEILALAQKEERYDVFICYKETDFDGHRTPDSVIANDIYYQLTNEGFKVFYAAITLEGKLGSAYEPIIFAALNSAKVMLVIGTKPEYFNAVWVKNEWSRFLKIIKKDRTKLLIPCYRDMDAYELPDEFAHLQAQDMAKIGFVNDIARGIKKVVKKDEVKHSVVKETVVTNIHTNANTALLLKRVHIFIEDSDWESADEYCEKILDQDPENAEAYLGKLMAELHVKNTEALKSYENLFEDNTNLQRALKYANGELRNTVEEIAQAVDTRKKERIYANATGLMKRAQSENNYTKLAEAFELIADYRDAALLAKECYDRADAIRSERELAEKRRQKRKKVTKWSFVGIAALICVIIVINAVVVPFIRYSRANSLMNSGNIIEAYEIFVDLEDYKDSAEKASSIYAEYKAEKLRNAQVGDIIFFGSYEQDNDSSNGKEDIEWIVLEVKDGKALVISKFALDSQRYNKKYANVTWATCTLRKWLNNDFLNTAFSQEEQASIDKVTLSADKNPSYDTDAGADTKDKVFLLSIKEVNKYMSSESAKMCVPTEYALANGAYYNTGNNTCRWLLRTAGSQSHRVSCVDGDTVNESGHSVDASARAIRPAIWIDINN